MCVSVYRIRDASALAAQREEGGMCLRLCISVTSYLSHIVHIITNAERRLLSQMMMKQMKMPHAHSKHVFSLVLMRCMDSISITIHLSLRLYCVYVKTI